MYFGVCLRIEGVADSPYFARAERIAQCLKQSLKLNERDIQIEMISSSAWPSHSLTVRRRYGFTAADENSPVLVYEPHTGRYIGNEKAFREWVLSTYNVTCDLEWGQLQVIARENAALLAQKNKAIAHKRRKLVIALIGAPLTGKSTQAALLSQRLNLPVIDVDELRAGSDAPLARILHTRLSQADCDNGFIFDAFPTTVADANVLLNSDVQLSVLLELVVDVQLSWSRLAGRRVHEATRAIFHLEFNTPKQANIALEITKDKRDTQRIFEQRQREYDQRREDVRELFREQVRDVDAASDIHTVLKRLEDVVALVATTTTTTQTNNAASHVTQSPASSSTPQVSAAAVSTPTLTSTPPSQPPSNPSTAREPESSEVDTSQTPASATSSSSSSEAEAPSSSPTEPAAPVPATSSSPTPSSSSGSASLSATPASATPSETPAVSARSQAATPTLQQSDTQTPREEQAEQSSQLPDASNNQPDKPPETQN